MKTSRAGIDLIKRWEGCRLTAYKCSAGVLTIGYGHTSAAGEPKVTASLKITQEAAEEILVQDLVKYEAAVQKALTRSPTQNQFDAMVSLCVNIGPGAFAKSSLVRKFNGGDLQGAADAFLMWRKAAGKVIPGLEARRQAERTMFLKPSAAAQPKPVVVRNDEPVLPRPKPELPATDAPRPSAWARFIAWLKG